MTAATPTRPAKRIYKFREAAEQLAMSEHVLRQLIKDGVIESTFIGRNRVVTAAALDRYAVSIDELSISGNTQRD